MDVSSGSKTFVLKVILISYMFSVRKEEKLFLGGKLNHNIFNLIKFAKQLLIKGTH